MVNTLAESTDSGITEPMPETVIVVWQDEHRQEYRKEVDVSKDRVGRSWVTIYFVVWHDGTVRVRTARTDLEPPRNLADVP